jgi:deoxyribonuclease V
MLACVDVAYGESIASAACLVFRTWVDSAAVEHVVAEAPLAEPYRPGEFFRRELPAILAVLELINAKLEIIVVDGYVWLGAARPGLGARLYRALNERIPVVGVAKNRWAAPGPVDGWRRTIPVVRGRSAKPLFVTSAGLDVGIAAALVASMHGKYRVPTLLAAVDRLARVQLERSRTPR